MEVLNRSTPASVDLPPIRIDTAELLEIIDRLPGEGPVEVLVGDYSDPQRIRLNGREDVEKNQSSISVPITIKKDTLEISVRKGYVSVTSPFEKIHILEAAKRILFQYKPWFHFIGSAWFFALVVGGSMMALTFTTSFEGFELFSFQLVVAMMFGVPLEIAKRNFLTSKVQYYPRSTFLQRNKDSIIMLILGAIVGGIATKFFQILDS